MRRQTRQAPTGEEIFRARPPRPLEPDTRVGHGYHPRTSGIGDRAAPLANTTRLSHPAASPQSDRRHEPVGEEYAELAHHLRLGHAKVLADGRGVYRSPGSTPQQRESQRIQSYAEEAWDRYHRFTARLSPSPRSVVGPPPETTRHSDRTWPIPRRRSTSIDPGTGAVGSPRTARCGCPVRRRSSVLR